MQTVLGWFSQRPLRLVGGLIVFFSTGLLTFLVLLDMIAGLNNPYLGVVTYMLLPGALVLGLLLVPVDAWLQRRRAAHGLPPYPVIDLCDLRQRKIALFFGLTSVAILIVMTVVTYKSVEYMDTKDFCGKLCHKVMMPQYTAYTRSSHASVECVQCHIGPGAPFFVRAKLSGIPQVWHYLRGDYPRPLPNPVHALRPSRDTCENCHWPQEFYGNTLRTTVTHQQDRANSRDVKTMLMHVGSGSVPGSGIHSHMVSRIDYLPAVENRSEIAWVRVKRADGSVQEFVNPGHKADLAKLRKAEQTRLMDCIDCHNRAAHDFVGFETLLDDGLKRRQVDPRLPFVKREAMAAVGEVDGAPSEAEQARALKRIQGLRAFYARELGAEYDRRKPDVERSIRAIKDTYLSTVFPHMKSGPGTYPNWRSHDGCFRCHGTLEAADPKGRDESVSGDCALCHTDQVDGDAAGLLTQRQ